MPAPDLSIIIVSWNVKALIKACLLSVIKHTQNLSAEIIVIDNNSQDGSPLMIAKHFPGVLLLCNSHNTGFGHANNQALAVARGKYILFLNPDTLIIDDSLEKMRDVLAQDSQIGAVGCQLIDENHVVDFHCATRFPRIGNLIFEPYLSKIIPGLLKSYTMKEWDHRNDRQVDVLSGACVMVKKAVLDQVGYFDEDIFMYAEDVDLSFRIKASGYALLYLARSRVIHYGKQSTAQNHIKTNAEAIRSMRKYFHKHHSAAYAALFEMLMIGNITFRAFVFWILNLRPHRGTRRPVRPYLQIASQLIRHP